MNTRIAAIAAAALLAVLLTGCGEDTTAQDTEKRSTAQDAPNTDNAESTDSGAVLSADDERFLDLVRGELLFDTGIADATDDYLIAAGHDACAQVKAGVDLEKLRLVDGEKPAASGYYMDTSAILFGAQQVYCPETIVDVG